MSSIRTRIVALACALWTLAASFAAQAPAQELTGLARVDPAASGAEALASGAVELRFALDRAVPWRAFTLDAPPRLVLDFSEVDWNGLDGDGFVAGVPGLEAAATGRFRPGWSRMVVRLAGPLAITAAEMRTSELLGARVRVRLEPGDPARFAALSGAPESAVFRLPEPARDLPAPRPRQHGDRPIVVVLDPGHGGIDPGAERDGAVEAELMLTFARELAEVLRRDGMEVRLTRDEDVFVPLEMRQSIARSAGADVFISLHADALAEGRASGATVYTLSDTASDAASRLLAERHDRGDLLAGLDLSSHDDVIAGVLMDLARTETAPRADRLADALVAGLRESIGNLHKHPRLEANFSVLKAPDIPSVLVELGFLSDPRDLARLRDPAWRARAAAGIAVALRNWAVADAAEADLVRR